MSGQIWVFYPAEAKKCVLVAFFEKSSKSIVFEKISFKLKENIKVKNLCVCFPYFILLRSTYSKY